MYLPITKIEYSLNDSEFIDIKFQQSSASFFSDYKNDEKGSYFVNQIKFKFSDVYTTTQAFDIIAGLQVFRRIKIHLTNFGFFQFDRGDLIPTLEAVRSWGGIPGSFQGAETTLSLKTISPPKMSF